MTPSSLLSLALSSTPCRGEAGVVPEGSSVADLHKFSICQVGAEGGTGGPVLDMHASIYPALQSAPQRSTSAVCHRIKYRIAVDEDERAVLHLCTALSRI